MKTKSFIEEPESFEAFLKVNTTERAIFKSLIPLRSQSRKKKHNVFGLASPRYIYSNTANISEQKRTNRAQSTITQQIFKRKFFENLRHEAIHPIFGASFQKAFSLKKVKCKNSKTYKKALTSASLSAFPIDF